MGWPLSISLFIIIAENLDRKELKDNIAKLILNEWQKFEEADLKPIRDCYINGDCPYKKGSVLIDKTVFQIK